MVTPIEVLQKYWGYPAFREKQEEIIASVIDGCDTFALLPTGGGKSICYQVPALVLEGVCFVVSPLIALMRDQVNQLKSRGISATYLYGGLSKKEITIELENIRNNKYKLVYVSPERLQSKAFKQNLKRTKISFLAVDEAHCISQWGHEFRPEYREISIIKEDLKDLTIIALTASATKVVKEDIIKQLLLRQPNVITKSFYRSNLRYEVKYDEDKRSRLVEACKTYSGSGIIYVRTRRRTEEIAQLLKQKNITADFYHGGLSNQVRNVKQDNWAKGMSKVMVATNAFGMGIDKSDVRFVLHFDLPESIEAYYQEAGRAGRDEQEAHCVLYYDEQDIKQLRAFANSQFPTLDRVQSVYESLCNYLSLAFNTGQDARFDFNLAEFCEKFEWKAIEAYAAIKTLQKLGYIHLSEGIHRPSKLKINVTSTQLYDIQLRYPKLDQLIKTILRSYSGIYDYYTQINERQIAQRSKRDVQSVIKDLKQLDKLDVWTYLPSSEKPFITFMQSRVRDIQDAENTIETSKARTMDRIEAMVEYVESEHCRSIEICHYFGESEVAECQVCDLCEMRHQLGTKKTNFMEIEKRVLSILSKQEMTIQELVIEIAPVKSESVIEVTNWLVADKKVLTDKSGYLRLPK